MRSFYNEEIAKAFALMIFMILSWNNVMRRRLKFALNNQVYRDVSTNPDAEDGGVASLSEAQRDLQ